MRLKTLVIIIGLNLNNDGGVNMVEIYPSYTLIFLVFNLLGWWFKGQTFFSWWWFIPVIVVQVVIQSLSLAITKKILRVD